MFPEHHDTVLEPRKIQLGKETADTACVTAVPSPEWLPKGARRCRGFK